MHELSIASSIAEHVMAFANTPPAKRITKVIVSIGEMTCVEPEQLRFSYEAITKETPLEESGLEFEKVPVRVFCRQCGYEGKPRYWEDARADSTIAIATLQCPQCGKTAEASEGHDCTIKTIRYVQI
jgi:hydrogenase nickel incorporation protein HypA/HybF